MIQTRPLLLASASPRRREILTRLGLVFTVEAADIDESRRDGEEPHAYVTRLAEEKVRAIAERRAALDPRQAVLGADTTVVVDGQVLNKPVDLAESEQMLRSLRGREHVVHTAVAVLLRPELVLRLALVTTRVRFRDFSDATLLGYVASGEGMDKAGSYGIQDLGAALVSELHGSYTNVVGLPAAETLELLEALEVVESWP
ncbi:MAG: septum formation protein Maf [Myxococcaceae bacterium]|nr:septum formation protein Maf [Myxococcaceae bacterium]